MGTQVCPTTLGPLLAMASVRTPPRATGASFGAGSSWLHIRKRKLKSVLDDKGASFLSDHWIFRVGTFDQEVQGEFREPPIESSLPRFLGCYHFQKLNQFYELLSLLLLR